MTDLRNRWYKSQSASLTTDDMQQNEVSTGQIVARRIGNSTKISSSFPEKCPSILIDIAPRYYAFATGSSQKKKQVV